MNLDKLYRMQDEIYALERCHGLTATVLGDAYRRMENEFHIGVILEVLSELRRKEFQVNLLLQEALAK